MRIGGRHAFIGILGGDTIDELALGEVARHDGACAVLPFRLRIRLTVQSQLGFACRAVRPVTFVTIIRENGPDIAIKAEGCRRDGRGNHDENSRRESHFQNDGLCRSFLQSRRAHYLYIEGGNW